MHGVRSPAFVEMKGNVSTIDLANGKRTPVGLPKGNILANPHKADGAAQASKICKMHKHTRWPAHLRIHLLTLLPCAARARWSSAGRLSDEYTVGGRQLGVSIV